jgi:hypothetical protein
MPQPPLFRYSLRKEISFGNYEYYYLDASGNAVTQVAPYYLEHFPSGWLNQTQRWGRNWKKYGIFTSYTVPLKFVRDGAKILRYLAYVDGIEANCTLFIEELNVTDESYSTYFRGEVDLSTKKDERDYFTAVIKNDRYVDKLTAREGSDYTIDIDTNPNNILVRFDGMDLLHTLNYSTIKEPVNGGGGHISTPNTAYRSERMPSLVTLPPDGIGNGDLIYKGFTPPSSMPLLTYAAGGTEIPLGRENDWFLHNDSNNTYPITLDIDFQMLIGSVTGSPDSCRLRVYAVRANQGAPFTVQQKHLLFISGFVAPGTNTTVQCTSSNSITLAPDEALWLTVTGEEFPLTPTPGNNYYVRMYQGDLNIRYFNKVHESFVKCLRPNDVFGELVSEMSDGGTTHFSNVLDIDYKDFVVTSGDAVRSLEGAKLKTSFEDFFSSFNRILNLGTSYNNVTNQHIIDYKSAYFDKASPIMDGGSVLNLGEVKDCNITDLRDRYFSTLLAGYKDYTYDALNGRGEPNCRVQWLTPVTKVSEENDMTSEYRTDSLGIETLRANLIGKITTDSDSDNDNILVAIEPIPSGTHNGVPYYNLLRDPGLTVDGVISPSTIYNIPFSPKRNIIRNGSYIRSYLYLMDALFIKHQTSSKNGDMETNDGTTIINESADILVSSLDDPLFYPLVAEFEAAIPMKMQQILDANPTGYFEFNWRGTTWEAFILQVLQNPKINAPQTVRALLTPNNDLSKLKQ